MLWNTIRSRLLSGWRGLIQFHGFWSPFSELSLFPTLFGNTVGHLMKNSNISFQISAFSHKIKKNPLATTSKNSSTKRNLKKHMITKNAICKKHSFTSSLTPHFLKQITSIQLNIKMQKRNSFFIFQLKKKVTELSKK
jgi:hypothetical protein